MSDNLPAVVDAELVADDADIQPSHHWPADPTLSIHPDYVAELEHADIQPSHHWPPAPAGTTIAAAFGGGQIGAIPAPTSAELGPGITNPNEPGDQTTPAQLLEGDDDQELDDQELDTGD